MEHRTPRNADEGDDTVGSVGSVGFVPITDFALTPGEPKAGIARMAAGASEVDFRNEVEYRDLPCRSLIAPVQSRRVPIDFSINPYRGCEFGCVYCYARYTHEYMELVDWLDFERKVFVKRDAAAALAEDLRRHDFRGKSIAIGTATDPYQPAERRFGLTRSLLEVLARHRNLQLSITTKSDLVTRDLDLLLEIREHSRIQVNVTVTTARRDLARRIEPRAPRPDKRLAAVKTLSSAGIPTAVFLMPILPRINDALPDLEDLVRQAAEAGARTLATQVLFLRSCSKKRFFPFIEERFPELLPYYRRLYASYHTEALAAYTREKTAQVQELKRKYGLQRPRHDEAVSFAPDQLSLAGW